MRYDIEAIKRQSIKTYLAHRGLHPRRDYGNKGAYFSPFRQETVPSFYVYYASNSWHDYGEGQGGSIIDLDMRLTGCSFAESLEQLGNDTIPAITYIPKSAQPHRPGITILDVSRLESPGLLEYIAGRGIGRSVAQQYCYEVWFQCGGRRPQQAIGFRNDDDGWELRGENIKLSSSPKTVTTISHSQNSVSVYEGFMDFLSAVELRLIDEQSDAVVLNSVSNIDRCLLFLLSHREIRLFLDNDPAGRKGVTSIREALPTIRIYDYSYLYEGHNDLNEYVQSKQQRKEL